MQATFSSTTFTPDRLIAGDADDLLHEPITLIAGQNLARGAVLGRITASGKYTLSLAAAADGSQVPRAILVRATDASAGDKAAIAYVRGDFISSAVILGAGHTVASVKDPLRAVNIELISTQGGV